MKQLVEIFTEFSGNQFKRKCYCLEVKTSFSPLNRLGKIFRVDHLTKQSDEISDECHPYPYGISPICNLFANGCSLWTLIVCSLWLFRLYVSFDYVFFSQGFICFDENSIRSNMSWAFVDGAGDEHRRKTTSTANCAVSSKNT